jgi:LysM repeat protein
MRKLLAVVFFYSISLMANSQNITVEGVAPDLYITHIVAPKENFYSVSRLYNQPPKSIASFNKITMEKGLAVGQHLKIPLNALNFRGNAGSDADGSLPLTHIVAKGENIFEIGSSLHVTAQSIRKWNKLSSDKIAPGTPLIVGYLKTTNAHPSASKVSDAKNNTASAVKNSEAIQKSTETTEPKQVIPETKKDDPFISVGPGSNKKNIQTKERKQDENGQSVKDSQAISNSTVAEKDSALAVIPAETTTPANVESVPAKKEPLKQQETSFPKKGEDNRINQAIETGNAATGTFEDIYAVQQAQKTENSKSGEAATFRSISGWQDKKFYVLINNITPGTIVKISSSENKAVFAKVLGSMPEMKENNGLLLRISNAAASYLGIIDPKFPVQISYYQ